MGRKRKVPPGYLPRWNSDSEISDSQIDLHATNSYSTTTFPKRQKRHEYSSFLLSNSQLSKEEDSSNEYERPPEQFVPQEEENEQRQVQNEEEKEDIATTDEELEEEEVKDEDKRTEEEKSTEGEKNEEEEEEEVQKEPMETDIDQSTEEQNNPYFNENEEDYDPIPLQQSSDDEVDEESFQYVMQQFSEEWIRNEIKHKVSKQASSGFWNVAIEWMSKIDSAFNRENKKKLPKFDHIRRKISADKVPPISMDIGFIDKETQELTVVNNANKIPLLQFPRDKFVKAFEIASIKVRTISSCIRLLRVSCLFLFSTILKLTNTIRKLLNTSNLIPSLLNLI